MPPVAPVPTSMSAELLYQDECSPGRESPWQPPQSCVQDSCCGELIIFNDFLSLAHIARLLSLATKILSSVVSDEEEFLACLILKIVVSDKRF